MKGGGRSQLWRVWSTIRCITYETVREQNQYNWEPNKSSKKDHERGKGACGEEVGHRGEAAR